jgi:antitoxin component of MazEF toxin-antitoxin module
VAAYKAKVTITGNSLSVPLHKNVAARCGLKAGDVVSITCKDGEFTARKVEPAK